MRDSVKRELGVRLANHPLLRLLLFNGWFRLALAGCTLCLLALPLGLVPLLRVTPPGFKPRIRISALDWLQARALRRAALRAEADGRTDEARFAWQAAIANDPGDPELLRDSLRSVARAAVPPANLDPVLEQATWLLQLTGTNRADLELAAGVAEACRLDDWELALLGARIQSLDPPLEARYLKTLFLAGKVDRFDERCARRFHRALDDPELDLCLAAYAVGWGPLHQFAAADQTLESALLHREHGPLAARLQLRVAKRLGDLDRCERACAWLQAHNADTIGDHVVHWQLLDELGRRADAVRLATGCSRSPQTALETVCEAQALVGLGLHSEAGALLDHYANRFIPADPVWILHAKLLLQDRQWDEARALALQIRLLPNVRAALLGFSYYVEGCAEAAENRPASAEAAFSHCAAAEYSRPALGLAIAGELDRLGDAADARDLLLRLGPQLDRDPAYWRRLFDVATKLKDSKLVLAAAAAGYRLQPDQVAAVNDYAAARLLCEQEPEKTLALTVQVLAQHPDSAAARINHSLALLQNRRAAEARALLHTVEDRGLAEPAATVRALTGFETCLALHQYNEARQESQRVDPQHLFPQQRERFELERRRLPPVSAHGS